MKSNTSENYLILKRQSKLISLITKYLSFHKLNIFTEIKLVVMNHQAAINNTHIYNFMTSASDIFKNKLKIAV